MPIPHQEMRRMIKRRLARVEPRDRARVLRAALEEMPGYYSGPYGELRRWVERQLAEAATRRGAEHHDAYFIARQGAAQVALVGAPNAGKSSLLVALTGRQVPVGSYPFTTVRPAEGMVVLHGAPVQLLDLPGLIEGGDEGRGDGRSVLAQIRVADALVFVDPIERKPAPSGEAVRRMVRAALPELPWAVVGTKVDLASPAECRAWEARWAEVPHARCAASTGAGLADVQQLLWRVAGLMAVYPKRPGQPPAQDPVVLPPGSTVLDFVRAMHRDWEARFTTARVTGPSARFAGQTVGRDHVLQDGDHVELSLKGS